MIGKGYVHVYTGDGKGKTTAALGLALRAAGAGLRVFVAQFLKAQEYSELAALARFADLVTVHQYGTGRFVRGRPTVEDRERAAAGFAEAEAAVLAGRHELVILDEVNVAVRYGLVPLEELLALIRAKPEGVELVLTGRHADPALIEAADLVTEMRAVKHYFREGVGARVGVEK